MNPLLIPLVIRGIKGIGEIARRSDVVARTSIINRDIPIGLPKIIDGIKRQDILDYFQKPENQAKFADENKFPGFSKSLNIIRMTLDEALSAGENGVQDKDEYKSHWGTIKQLMMLHDPSVSLSKELVALIEGKNINLTDSELTSERKQEIVLGFFMIGARRSGAEFVASKIALIIVDVLAEVGSDYAGQVVKDPSLAKVLEIFLTVFSEPDLEELEKDEFLRHILKATFVTVSENAEIIIENELLGTLIKSVAKEASTDVQALLAGKLYGKLVSIILGETAKHTDALVDDKLMSKVLSSVLNKAATEPNVKDLFSEKGLEKLLATGLKAVAENNELWIGDVEHPLLKKIVEGVVDKVVELEDKGINLFKRENLVSLIDVTLGVMAKNPGLITDSELNGLIGNVLTIISDQGVVKAFQNREALLVRIAQEAIKEAGEKSHLLIKDKFASEVLEAILKSSSNNLPKILSEQGLRNILVSALDAAASNIQLINMKDKYKTLLEDVVKTLDKDDFSNILQGKNLENIFIEIIGVVTKNIPFFVENNEGRIIAFVLQKVLNAAKNDPTKLLNSDTIVILIKDILGEISTNQDIVINILNENIPLGELIEKALEIINGTFKAKVDGPKMVEVVNSLFEKLLSGDLSVPLDVASIKVALEEHV